MVYKSDVNAGCTYTVTDKASICPENPEKYYHSLCSASKLCSQKYPERADCSAFWKSYSDLPKASSAKYTDVCANNYYIHSCKTYSGATITNPTSANIGQCADGFVCSACPNGGNTMYPSRYYSSGGSDEYVYICSSTDAATGSSLGYVYMQEVHVVCSDASGINSLNPITKCYQPGQSQFSDTSGTYKLFSSCFYSN